MNVIGLALLGAGAGLGVVVTWRALTPRPTPIPVVLNRLARPGTAIGAEPDATAPALDRIGSTARRVAEALGHRSERLTVELELVSRTAEGHAFDKIIAAIAGLLVPNLAATGLLISGIAVPVPPIAVMSLILAVVGFILPDFLLREEAERRRRAFRHALSSYLDLVNVLLAGGAGIETALHAAADAGDGWGFQTIRSELHRARLTGRSPWDTFAALAERIDVSELAELAASVSLAGSHGARIRASLAAKADTLRGHQIAETETAANAATERMTIPVAVLLFGFLVFIAYPAIAQITSVAGPQP